MFHNVSENVDDWSKVTSLTLSETRTRICQTVGRYNVRVSKTYVHPTHKLTHLHHEITGQILSGIAAASDSAVSTHFFVGRSVRLLAVVCRSHSCPLLKPDLDAMWQVRLWGPMIQYYIRVPDPSGKEKFGSQALGQNMQVLATYKKMMTCDSPGGSTGWQYRLCQITLSIAIGLKQ